MGQPVVIQGQAVTVSADPKVSPEPIKAEVINNEVPNGGQNPWRDASPFCPSLTRNGFLMFFK